MFQQLFLRRVTRRRQVASTVAVLSLIVIIMGLEWAKLNSSHFSLRRRPRGFETARILGIENCTQEQMQNIHDAIPNQKALHRISRCPHAAWLTKFGTAWLDSGKRDPLQPLVAVFGGCNKGYDAINTLRLFSRNDSIQLPLWRKGWRGVPRPDGMCKQGKNVQTVVGNTHSGRKVHVHCVEASPATYHHLEALSRNLQWHDSFHVHHLALSNEAGGTILFPNVRYGGIEFLGVATCEKVNQSTCTEVARSSIDSFLHLAAEGGGNENRFALIDFLSIDTEGHDWPVLQGASNTLKRTKYLEFEFHEVGHWRDTNLSTVLHFLSLLGFRCYWAGKDGMLFRITGCFRAAYDSWRTWSNVACVNVNLAPDLSKSMEDIFLETVTL